jgi:hypothetical protein
MPPRKLILIPHGDENPKRFHHPKVLMGMTTISTRYVREAGREPTLAEFFRNHIP